MFRQKLINKLKSLYPNSKGVTALEFAIVAPIVFIVIFLSIEVSFMLLADATLERAASQITRDGKIGKFEGADCFQKVYDRLDNELSFWADRQNLQVDTTVYKPGQNIEFDEDAEIRCNAGERGDMVVYRLKFEKPGLTGLISMIGIDVFKFERIVIIQNEP